MKYKDEARELKELISYCQYKKKVSPNNYEAYRDEAIETYLSTRPQKAVDEETKKMWDNLIFITQRVENYEKELKAKFHPSKNVEELVGCLREILNQLHKIGSVALGDIEKAEQALKNFKKGE